MKKIIIYSTATCPYCKMVKEYLKNNNIEFVDFDVADDQAKAEEMIKKSGQMGVPVLDIEGKIIVGFDREKINQELGLS
jgi:glutaredoxin-like YruB-family protein